MNCNNDDPNHHRDRCSSFTMSSATVRPPRRKRRPSVGVDGADDVVEVGSRLSSTAESLDDLRAFPSTQPYPGGGGRAGSVPPVLSSTHSPPSMHTSSTSPAPFPRIRRHFRQKSMLSVSPSSAPTIVRGSSAIDLSDIAPFGCLQQPDSFQQSVKGFASNLRRRNSFKSGVSANKWPWSWHRSSGGSANKEPNPSPDPPAPLKYSGSLLSGRKRKSRHISCPDISSASSESSRSTSPSSSSLKVSLTSLFHRTSPSSSMRHTTATRPPPSAPVAIRHPSNSGKVSTNVDSTIEVEEALVGEFMSAICTDDTCGNYLAEFAGMDFYPDSNENR